MGIFSPRRWMGLTPAICTVLCFMLSACNSTDEPIEEALSNAKPEMILKSATIIQYTIKGRFMSR